MAHLAVADHLDPQALRHFLCELMRALHYYFSHLMLVYQIVYQSVFKSKHRKGPRRTMNVLSYSLESKIYIFFKYNIFYDKSFKQKPQHWICLERGWSDMLKLSVSATAVTVACLFAAADRLSTWWSWIFIWKMKNAPQSEANDSKQTLSDSQWAENDTLWERRERDLQETQRERERQNKSTRVRQRTRESVGETHSLSFIHTPQNGFREGIKEYDSFLLSLWWVKKACFTKQRNWF